ncbi:fructose-specific phosphotransferase system IIA component [Kroppenstedtia sanguinis]|uniref:PTS sugar transporter subunit IIA n=1 Tax=Kroppenstedtia sanguinis TaxID=1380684 RepID=UPI003D23C146
MKLTDLISEDLVKMELTGTSKDEVMEEMADLIDQSGALNQLERFKKDLYLREKEGSTGIGFGIAIPHGKSDGVNTARVALGIKREGIEWNSMDGEKAKLIFMIAVPEKNAGQEHLKILQMLSRKLMDEAFRTELLNSQTKETTLELLGKIE